MTGAKFAAAWVCAAWFCIGTMAAHAAPDEPKTEAKDDAKASACLASPKGTTPAGEKWFYRVERGTKRHCWYTRAPGARRVAEPAAQPSAASKPGPTQPKPAPGAAPDVPIQLEQSVANARAEANLSATAAMAPPQPDRAAEPPNWQLAQRWSDHQNGGAPFEARPVAAPMPITPPPSEPDAFSAQTLLVIAGGAFGFAALATVLVMIFARRQQRREAASSFALFATTNDPKRRFVPRRADDEPAQTIRPRLAPDEDERPAQPLHEPNDEPPMRPFTPRNMRMDHS